MHSSVDWSALLELAVDHRVLPLVYTRFRGIGEGLVPPEDMEQWRMRYHASAGRSMFLATELLAVLRLFETHGITSIPFKGPALAEAAYGNVTMRQSADLDILVQEKDILRARDVLLDHGYPPEHSFTAKQENAHIKRTCEFTFLGRRTARQYSVDVHFRLAAHYLAAGLDSEAVFARRQPGRLTDTRSIRWQRMTCCFICVSTPQFTSGANWAIFVMWARS